MTAGFGDALTAALDVMAFAHDFDLPADTAEGIPADTAEGIPADKANEKQWSKTQRKVTSNNCQGVPSTNSPEENSQVKLPSSVKLNDLTTDSIEKPIEPTNIPIGEFFERK